MDYVTIGIIVGLACLAVALYFVYRRASADHEAVKVALNDAYKRVVMLEAILTKPPPRHEIRSVVESVAPDKCDGCSISPTRPSTATDQVSETTAASS